MHKLSCFCDSEWFLHVWDLSSELYLIAPIGLSFTSSQQADLEKVPYAWYVGVCSSERSRVRWWFPCLAEMTFIGKVCINFFLVSLSFPSTWSHSGYVERLEGPAACNLWPPSVPIAVWASFLAIPDCCPTLCRAAGLCHRFPFSGDCKAEHAVTWWSPFRRSGCASGGASTVSSWRLFTVASRGTLAAGKLRYLLAK